MKKALALVLILSLTVTACIAISAEDTTEKMTVTLDGQIIGFPDAQPFIDSRDRTLVPIRFVSEAMGADVSWEDETQTVTIVKRNDTITYEIGEFGARLNGVAVFFDTVGILKEERTFVPLRFISELLNCTVDWFEDTYTVAITSPPEPIDFPEPEVTLHFPDSQYDGRAFWITLDNIRDYPDREDYQFKIDFTNPVEFNVMEYDAGAILGWETLHLNQWSHAYVSGSSLFEVIQKYYTTRENMETFKLYDGMPLEYTLSVKRLSTGEIREYNYTDTLELRYPNK